MNNALLFDTDVLIEYLRGRQRAADYLNSVEESDWYISAMTVAELYAGMRSSEDEQMRDFLTLFDVVVVDADQARQAGRWRNEFRDSHGTGLADAVIAAGARSVQATLVTFHERHYPMVDAVLSPWERS